MKYEKGGVNVTPQSHPGSRDLPVGDFTLPSPQSFPFSPETENTGVEGRFNGGPESKNLSLVRIGALPALGLFLSTKQRAPGPRLTLARVPRTVYIKAMSGCDPSA